MPIQQAAAPAPNLHRALRARGHTQGPRARHAATGRTRHTKLPHAQQPNCARATSQIYPWSPGPSLPPHSHTQRHTQQPPHIYYTCSSSRGALSGGHRVPTTACQLPRANYRVPTTACQLPRAAPARRESEEKREGCRAAHAPTRPRLRVVRRPPHTEGGPA